MSPASRRAFLGALVSGSLALLSGCSGALFGGSTTNEDDKNTESVKSEKGSKASKTNTTGRSTQTSTPVFTDFSIENVSTTCPEPDYAYHAVTPVPYPTPVEPANINSVIGFLTDVESAYLDNWVVLNYDPIPTPTSTPETPTPHEVDYPEIFASYQKKVILQDMAKAFVIHFQYERIVGDKVEGRYTVNYYISSEGLARAEEEGYVYPGPHPTEDGKLISCDT